jgi:mannose-1-phosphate guanylyltransferase/mannose-1-phosphate guanylyltransferase/mannose-6-phosphate isomerase
VNENVLKAKNIVLESRGNYVNSRKLVALIGAENLIVVETEDAILIAARDKSEDVKKVVSILQQKRLNESL